MDYRKIGEAFYVRMDRDDEIVSTLIAICKENDIKSATFSGIGGCQSAEIQTFIPDEGVFETERLEGMLELVSINGNIILDDSNEYRHHTHAMFAYKKDGAHHTAGGHLRSTVVLYTAEIELRPVIGGRIGKRFDPETGTGFWNFD